MRLARPTRELGASVTGAGVSRDSPRRARVPSLRRTLDLLLIRRMPQSDCPVEAGGRERLAVGREGQGHDRARVPAQREQFFEGGR